MTDSLFAMFLTWTTYGTWLPGDERGHVSNTVFPQGKFLPKQNRPGTPYQAGDQYSRERARDLQKWETVWLTVDQAGTVAESLLKAATTRSWCILRAAVMTNHVHVVMTGCPADGPAVRRILKGTSQAALSRAAGCSRRVWTAGGSNRIRTGEKSIVATVQYVAEQPGKLAEIVDNVLVVPSGD